VSVADRDEPEASRWEWHGDGTAGEDDCVFASGRGGTSSAERWHQLGRWVRPVQVDTSLVGKSQEGSQQSYSGTTTTSSFQSMPSPLASGSGVDHVAQDVPVALVGGEQVGVEELPENRAVGPMADPADRDHRGVPAQRPGVEVGDAPGVRDRTRGSLVRAERPVSGCQADGKEASFAFPRSSTQTP
jgi:hypothetical protein